MVAKATPLAIAPTPLSHIDDAERQLLTLLSKTPYEKLRVKLKSGDVMNAIVAGPKDAPRMVVCHGWGAGLGFFGGILDGLSKEYRVYLVDWLGCGASSRPYFGGGWSPEEAEGFFVDAFEEFCDEVDLANFVLVGHSLGGFLSVEFCLRRSNVVKGLVLVSPVGVGVRDRGKVVKGGWVRWLFLWLVFWLWEYGWTPQMITRVWWFGWWFAAWIIRQRWGKFDDEVVSGLTRYFYEISRAKASGERALSTILESGAWARSPLCHKLPKVDCSTMFLYGEKDWMDWHVGEKARKSMKVWTELKRVDNAGHHIYLDNPRGFNVAVLDACEKFERDAQENKKKN
eukprot:Plantae.Rhodophyta-Hildenbrandia_rubra.ctg3046.p2 GENE.Plantae.Rhodophyta-Hildenbrandia_rubra.ctg3046~~Plantae.Rhodophyta-Hildenbrandia_rubra.ctg3046.p2  ORF type:complete len:342 (-),score=59.59 Plantae.Rhodophyta-Hildenbrandia_rubra.ctg3046:1735-2760(-)